MSDETIAIVLTGGGARGAYQAGALSVLLPELERRGERPTVLTGASAGALNAALVASLAHLPADEAVEWIRWGWGQAVKRNVLRPLWQQAPLTAFRYTSEVLPGIGARLQGLFDLGPLRRTLRRLLDWDHLHANVRDGVLDAVGVAATGIRGRRTTVFTETRREDLYDEAHAIRYTRTDLDVPHLLASASIPAFFNPVRVADPREDAGWYMDGSIRLHTPLKPALDLGAQRLLVMGTTSLRRETGDLGADEDTPDLGDAVCTILDATLEDSVLEDLRTLTTMNAALDEDDRGGRDGFRRVPYVFVGPSEHGELGRIARNVYHARFGGLKGVRAPEFVALHRLLGGDSPLQGQLLSYLLFDGAFIEELLELGARDAHRWVEEHPGLWRTAPLDALSVA